MWILGYALLFLVSILGFAYKYLKNRFQYWEKLKVPYIPTESLIFGNDKEVVQGKISFAENVHKLYKELAPHRYGGAFAFCNPILYIRDPELIKNILVKDFDHFRDRSFHLASENEPLTQHLFNLHGEKWKFLRAKLTPTFTSGKMKFMFNLLKECCDNLQTLIDELAESNETVNVKDVMSRYTIDVISSCAFGLQPNSMKDQNSEFNIMGKKVFTPTIRSRIRQLLFSFFPNVTNRVFRNIPQDITDFFINVVRETVEYRKKNNIERNDFLNLMVKLLEDEGKNELRSDFDKKLGLNFDLMTAQCFVFFLAGFETSSATLTYVIFELANNPEIQAKLQKEVDQVLEEHNDRITYECLQGMHYMDKILNESLRLHPATPILFRSCIKDYRIPDSNLILKKGNVIFIPVHGLHRDAQYFPDPEIFNPENFSEAAKNSRPNCVYLPFGEGPRNCIGIRFGLMQVKTAITMIMKSYNCSLAPEIKLPIGIKPHAFLSVPKQDVLVRFTRRNGKN